MALEVAASVKPSAKCRKLLLWLARAYDAGAREWLTSCVAAKLCGLSETEVNRLLRELKKLPAEVTGCCIQEQRSEHGKCGSFHEFRLTDDGLLFALEQWPKDTLEPMPKSVVKDIRGQKSAQYLQAAREHRQAEKERKAAAKRKRAA